MNDEELLKAYKVGRNIRMVKLSGLQALELMAQARKAEREMLITTVRKRFKLPMWEKIDDMLNLHNDQVAQARQQVFDELEKQVVRVTADDGVSFDCIYYSALMKAKAKHTEGKA